MIVVGSDVISWDVGLVAGCTMGKLVTKRPYAVSSPPTKSMYLELQQRLLIGLLGIGMDRAALSVFNRCLIIDFVIFCTKTGFGKFAGAWPGMVPIRPCRRHVRPSPTL